MTRLPRRVKFGGHVWTLTRVDLDPGLDIFGRTMKRPSVIEVDRDQGVEQERNTVVHELLHAIVSMAGDLGDDSDEERIVSTLSPWLLTMLRENPSLVRYLTERDS